MLSDLAELNKQNLSKYKRQIIEQAFINSKTRTYQMPRNLSSSHSSSASDIPSRYNLHAQNQSPNKSTIINLQKLININAFEKKYKSTQMTTKKMTICKVQNDAQSNKMRINKIKCTLSRSVSKKLQHKQVKKGWCCCLNEQIMQEQFTKQLILRAHLGQTKKKQNRAIIY